MSSINACGWVRAQIQRKLGVLCAIIVLAISLGARAQQLTKEGSPAAGKIAGAQQVVLWRQPDVAARDLFYGPGGEEHAPTGRFKFVEEDFSGTQPKFEIENERGARWKVKLGAEVQSETAATRLVWAAGYFTDEDYYLPELRVEGLSTLKRGQKYLSADGVVRGARLERRVGGEMKVGNWSWTENPFVGTRELNGLKVLLALINDWDLKEVNNDIHEEKGGERRYALGDLGASFGRNSNEYDRSKADVEGYRRSEFIKEIRPQEVDFVLQERPVWVTAVRKVHFREYGHMERLVHHLPRDDARWIGQVLAQLSGAQIGDAFRAAGFSPEEVEVFTATIQERIRLLSAL